MFGTPKSVFYKALRKKDIRINDVKISENISLSKGDEVKIYIADEFLKPKLPEINAVYEDENILAVCKPKGIEVTGEDSLSVVLGDSVFPCHRLDRNTSRTCFIC